MDLYIYMYIYICVCVCVCVCVLIDKYFKNTLKNDICQIVKLLTTRLKTYPNIRTQSAFGMKEKEKWKDSGLQKPS